MRSVQASLLNYVLPRLLYNGGEDYSTGIWRAKIVSRDKGKCQNCFNTLKDPVEGKTPGLEAHHIIPRAEGGRNTLNNGVTLCAFCHYYIGQALLNHGLDFRQLEALKSRVQRIRESRRLLRSAVFNRLERVIYG